MILTTPHLALFRVLLNIHTVEDTEANLVDRLRVTGSLILSLVAIEGQEVVGPIAFSPVRIDSTSGTKAAVGLLGPLGVRPTYQRRGIGLNWCERAWPTCKRQDTASLLSSDTRISIPVSVLFQPKTMGFDGSTMPRRRRSW
jgi:predicted N-acetyltransferase YhbS